MGNRLHILSQNLGTRERPEDEHDGHDCLRLLLLGVSLIVLGAWEGVLILEEAGLLKQALSPSVLLSSLIFLIKSGPESLFCILIGFIVLREAG